MNHEEEEKGSHGGHGGHGVAEDVLQRLWMLLLWSGWHWYFILGCCHASHSPGSARSSLR